MSGSDMAEPIQPRAARIRIRRPGARGERSESVTLDVTVRENVCAQLRVLVKRTLLKHGCPPDQQEKGTLTVLEHAAVLSERRAAA
jgi:type I restriction enzyme R subunit